MRCGLLLVCLLFSSAASRELKVGGPKVQNARTCYDKYTIILLNVVETRMSRLWYLYLDVLVVGCHNMVAMLSTRP